MVEPMRNLIRVGLLLTVLPRANAGAATIEIAYPALERMIVRSVMTDGGRYYMQGSPATPCQYAFVQDPRVQASAGRLRVTLLFSGKEAVEVAGRCVGAGDNFDVQLSGVPAYADGSFYLSDLKLESQESRYFQVVAGLIRSRLEERLRFSIKDAFEVITATSAASGAGNLVIENVRVDDVKAGDHALRFSMDFAAALRP